ncbi:hypothetical protein I6N90_06125 [Paenibacillus sp. GSMTC-2017]|uniref:hypothetical protein n=1 Tax=Paenibacillus sp. GSMTC-2017 TaxID=2794350 RepID=UPI0018D7C81D|nr:hypothetical protein [Paenibacillus sp. GSMTC-2017]MBH5317390.1 hypothetical protein [Paenibacillus sp. GSMTC-2017]
MWSPIDTKFLAPKLPVAIAAVADSSEAGFMRNLLEQLNMSVLLHKVGTPDDFLKVIGQTETAPPFLIISAHGDEGGIIFGEYMEGIDVSSLEDGVMMPLTIANAIALPGTVIFSAACSSGVEEAGQAFLKGGALAYIAADDDVSGEAITLFMMHFFYKLTKEEPDTLEEAWEHAASYDEESRLFRLYKQDGTFKIDNNGIKVKL